MERKNYDLALVGKLDNEVEAMLKAMNDQSNF